MKDLSAPCLIPSNGRTYPNPTALVHLIKAAHCSRSYWGPMSPKYSRPLLFPLLFLSHFLRRRRWLSLFTPLRHCDTNQTWRPGTIYRKRSFPRLLVMRSAHFMPATSRRSTKCLSDEFCNPQGWVELFTTHRFTLCIISPFFALISFTHSLSTNPSSLYAF